MSGNDEPKVGMLQHDWFTLTELSSTDKVSCEEFDQIMKGHVICPQCCREALKSDRMKKKWEKEGERLYHCPECGCMFNDPIEDDAPLGYEKWDE